MLLISNSLAKYGLAALFNAVLRNILAKGIAKEDILKQVNGYPVSEELKRKLREVVEEYFKGQEPPPDGEGPTTAPVS